MRSVVPVAVLALLLVPPTARAATGTARRSAARKVVHPDVGRDQDCRGCHAQATPAAFAAWSAGKHGIDLVTCVVCHGSTGADFARRPAMDRCRGCHAEQVAAAATPAMKGKDCFACHPAHALDPHPVRGATTAARLGADVELARERELAGPVNGPNPAADAAAKPAVAAPQASAPAAGPAAASNEKDLGSAKPHPPQHPGGPDAPAAAQPAKQ